MAFSSDRGPNDRGRHRRGRWWRRGSYLFSRRGEARPDADRSFWSDAQERRQEGGGEPHRTGRPGENGTATGPQDRVLWPGGDGPERTMWPLTGAPGRSADAGRGAYQGRERGEPGAGWDAFSVRERGERLPAAVVVDRPRYTWDDFELVDEPLRARPHRPDAPSLGDGLRHCGRLESILHRQWDARQGPPPADVVRAVESLARLPERLKELLASGLEGIYVGPGGVPDLDDMGYLRGAPLPSSRATWDICAGAYGDRKIVVGDRPSPTPDVMMHEVGHAIDDIDAAYGDWVSDSPEFVRLYESAAPLLASTFHRQGAGWAARSSSPTPSPRSPRASARPWWTCSAATRGWRSTSCCSSTGATESR
ncbi:unnamed protein product [[Actinomadura] parvosata subsp. kistnae]|uniref:hypothetical protein n=1 Tax=[Actinomadura] parvosata TaxID=1955412 RepID=UPI000D2636C6|nr:unnamed protein product [Actinomadura parvosata subsp. kistnae]